MKLRRRQPRLVNRLILVTIGAVVLRIIAPSPTLTWVLGGIVLLTLGVLVADRLRPFRFHIGADGLDLRVAGLNRLVPWAEIDAVILDQPAAGGSGSRSPSLLMVPATGSAIDPPLTGRSPVDNRPALTLLDLDRIQQPADEVAAALARFGGSRFADVRQPGRAGFDEPLFEVALRGYNTNQVDELVQRCEDALASGRASQRHEVKAELDRARGDLLLGLRGYDRRQVDRYLERVSVELASWDDEGIKPA
ncbi:DivIVA domain-containing protein [Micromonospora sp. NPDC051296]|uniref:DivIVA domain-containing protein n=1 Tax=Micromonospora sp. NPDC051296 TaxID=3155046 RepID=UPI003443D40B